MAGIGGVGLHAIRVAVLAAAGTALAATGGTALSPRNANYTIEVTLDTQAKTLQGHQVLEWRNLQDQPAEELWFHLYWNAWRNDRSTWMLENSLRSAAGEAARRIREDDWSFMQVDGARLLRDGDAPVDLLPGARFASPDDGNAEDRTVWVVRLPEPVSPGDTARVELTWQAKIPRTFARTGRRDNYYLIAHWFPAVGVFESDGWNCHQFHAGTEFFSDYGVYDVRLTVPRGYVVGATGLEVDQTDNGDGSVTHRYYQEDVHTFTWTTSRNFVVMEKRFFEPGLPPVEMRLLLQPEHLGQAQRHFKATAAALQHYGQWYGPYPYGHVTVVDPAYGSRTGGMEYPTLFTCGTRLYNPFGGGSPEGVTVHEAGHQFWYGIVGDNEFEHAWLDEGLNTFSTTRTMQTVYGDRFFVRRYLPAPGARSSRDNFFPVAFREILIDGWEDRLRRYRPQARTEDPETPTFRYHPASGRYITYDKTALWLATLERYLGWDTLQQILSTFFERYAFAHPTPEDFMAVATEVSGRDLDWFFDQVFHDSVDFDYAVHSVSSRPAGAEGLVERDGKMVYQPPLRAEPKLGTPYRSEVVVQRRGDGVFPVDILLVFEDGQEIREHWDGKERWRRIVLERPFKLSYAAVDPERTLALDLSRVNNAMRVERRAALPARKWGSKWMIMLQDLLSDFAFFM